LVHVYVVCDVNSGTEGLQVDSGDDCKKNQKQKNREGKTLSFRLLCLNLFLSCALLKVVREIFPLKPPAASHFSMGKNIGQDMVHHEPWGARRLICSLPAVYRSCMLHFHKYTRYPALECLTL
jgi:hypothetical protein